MPIWRVLRNFADKFLHSFELILKRQHILVVLILGFVVLNLRLCQVCRGLF